MKRKSSMLFAILFSGFVTAAVLSFSESALRGAGGVIPPNATLMFDVELLGVK